MTFDGNITFNGWGFLPIVILNLIIFTSGGRDIESGRMDSDRCCMSSAIRQVGITAEDSVSPRTMIICEHFPSFTILKESEECCH